MKIVIFGLTVSSSWGNGHATLWRGLCRALARRGHRVVFFERDVSYYSETRDLHTLPGGGKLLLYSTFREARQNAAAELEKADLAMTTSYCPDGREAAELILNSNVSIKAYYDLDTPITLHRLSRGEIVEYLPVAGLGAFDLVLSYTGGRAIAELSERLGARYVAPLYGSVDPSTHFPVPSCEEYRADLSYLGTYAADRQEALEELLIVPARTLSDRRFLIGGAQYPQNFPWASNIFFVRHMPPSLHPSFFCSSRATLNVTRREMAEYGYCPSGRLFEAAACGVPILTDCWTGLSSFFTPGHELVAVETSQDVTHALKLTDSELKKMGKAARERTLEEHTADSRVRQLEGICSCWSVAPPTMAAGN